ncbi:MAG: potassium/proton antiporter [Planctomycetes bacterium]|nr:potassium/proton antiporter [Planctomycetota bacterium]
MDLLYLVTPLLLIAVVLASVWLDRWSVPVILVAMAAGILFGSDVLNLWYFSDVHVANQVANLALVFILFQGGFTTKRDSLRSVALPALGLATWGVVLTAVATFLVLWGVLGWQYQLAALLAVIISSTDAAATFSILRRQALPPRLAGTVEIESAANDPMAILLTLVAVESFSSGQSGGWSIIPSFLWKFAAGPAIGYVVARLALALFNRLRPQDRGHYYVLFIGVVLFTYGVAEVSLASGMLAVFTAGYVLGNSAFIYKQGIANFSSAFSTVANIAMFVVLGLLVFPHQWRDIWIDGLILFAVLTLVARPCAVWLGTLGMRFGFREKLFLSWSGLRGAVPVVLATYPMARDMPIGQDVFNLVFFAVILSVLIQGSSLGGLARALGLAVPAKPPASYSLELMTLARSDLDVIVVDVPGRQGDPGPRIQDLRLPDGAAIAMIARGSEIVAPRGGTQLLGWDQITVLAHAKDEDAVRRAIHGGVSQDLR